MTPGKLDIKIYRGAAFSQTLQFYATGTTTPIVLSSGLRAEVRDNSKGPLLLNMSVDETDRLTGKIVISATASATNALRPHVSKYGIIGGGDELYAQGICTIEGMIPAYV
jgi:hypothetical protein